MSAYDAFVVCGPRDWVDYFSAFAPTVAAGVATVAGAGTAIWSTRLATTAAAISAEATRAGVNLQKALSNPRLSIQERVDPGSTQGVEWIVDLLNSGSTAGSITSFHVYVNDVVVPHPPMQPPSEFWNSVFTLAGIRRYGELKGHYWSGRVIEGTSSALLVSAVFSDPVGEDLARAMRKIRITADYTSLLGDQLTVARVLGAGQLPVPSSPTHFSVS